MNNLERVWDAAKQARLVDKSRRLARIIKHSAADAATVKERDRLEADLAAWIKHFGGEAFYLPFSNDHRRIIQRIQHAIENGGTFAMAMPRGSGKTTILKWATLYCVLTGKRHYVISVGATAELAQDAVEFCKMQLAENDELHKFYPHVTTYVRATDGKAIKARYQLRIDGKSTGLVWSKHSIRLPEVTTQGQLTESGEKITKEQAQPYPTNGAIIEAHGLTGAIRGKARDGKTGKVLRPDFVLIDDPQSRDSAESVSQTAMRERIIMGDILGLAGPRKKIAAVMPCTVIRKGDLAHRFLDNAVHPEWQGITTKLVNKWPDEQDGMWKEYQQIYRDGAAEGIGTRGATQFYAANRAAMDAGADVAWPERMRDGEISALQTAENLLIETGDQFYAEYQNEPKELQGAQYELSVEQVLSKANDTARLQIPATHNTLVGHCDINRAGLHWCVTSFDNAMTAHVLAYGRYPARGDLWPEKANALTRQQAIIRGLHALFGEIAATAFTRDGKRVDPALFLIDASFESDAVHRFAEAARFPFPVLPAIGRAAHRYRWHQSSIIGRPMEQCHRQRPLSRHKQYVMANVDYWREIMQRAFLGEAGEAGGCTIHAAQTPRAHVPFAEHLCAERLAQKYDTPLGWRYEWYHLPGTNWDWGDALTGCYVAAAITGLVSGGKAEPMKQAATAPRERVERPAQQPRRSAFHTPRGGGFATSW